MRKASIAVGDLHEHGQADTLSVSGREKVQSGPHTCRQSPGNKTGLCCARIKALQNLLEKLDGGSSATIASHQHSLQQPQAATASQ
jgi:hypothetical protein